MPRFLVISFPTLVLVVAGASLCLQIAQVEAAVTSASPDFDSPEILKDGTNSSDRLLERETVNIVEPPASAVPYVPPREYFYPYRQSLTLRAGQTTSSQTVNDTNTPSVAGLQYQFTNDERKIYEAGSDLLSDGTGTLSFCRRWILTRSRLRPYAKAGGGLLVKPSDGLAALVNFVNFRIDGSGGAEYLFYKSQSVRLDLEAALAAKAFTIIGTVGYVWAW